MAESHIGTILGEMWPRAARELMEGVCCEACSNPAEVHVLATTITGKMIEVIVCKDHLLDPGPLLDY